jgi:hypothetical protein
VASKVSSSKISSKRSKVLDTDSDDADDRNKEVAQRQSPAADVPQPKVGKNLSDSKKSKPDAVKSSQVEPAGKGDVKRKVPAAKKQVGGYRLVDLNFFDDGKPRSAPISMARKQSAGNKVTSTHKTVKHVGGRSHL